MIVNQGTDIAGAIEMAMQSFTQQEHVGKAIIVITDGEDHEGGAVEAAKEAQAKLEEFKEIAKAPAGFEQETIGTLALANPSTGELEPVFVTSRRFLTQKLIEFSVRRNGYVRATHIPRADFASLVSSVIFYRKIHPKEK